MLRHLKTKQHPKIEQNFGFDLCMAEDISRECKKSQLIYAYS